MATPSLVHSPRAEPAAPPRVSVILPTHDRAAFVPRAIESLLAQDVEDWELRIVDDGSTDDTLAVLAPYLDDERVHLRRLVRNEGLGAALNAGLDDARADLVAYLPSDDRYFAAHLGSLLSVLDRQPDAVLAWAGVRHHYNREALEPLPEDGLQLVQLLHRRSPGFRWLERAELVTDSLAWMGLDELARRGRFVPSGRVTCEWVAHPDQLHRLLREPVGGIAPYRRRFQVSMPLRFHSTVGDRIDEVERYRRYRSRPDGDPEAGMTARRPAPQAAVDERLRILLVGELAYNADRILALEDAGHRLFGLWMPNPYWYNTVGPLPFGHVVDATASDPAAAIRQTRPDVIYALLNWQAVPFAARVLRANAGVPFVWHFKEGPFISLEQGHWTDLVELVLGADGLIYSSEEMAAWFETAIPGATAGGRTLVLDGDLPKVDWQEGPFPARLSDADGEIHTVVPGRPIGLHPADVETLAALGVHVHFYGDFTQGQWRSWIERAAVLAPRHLHLHPTAGPEHWVDELGRYDAGWLHVFESRNDGDIRRADWDDLNVPARLATLAAAGLPMLLKANPGHVVAAERITGESGIGLPFLDWEDLVAKLRTSGLLASKQAAVLATRSSFTFDAHVDRLIAFFHEVIDSPRRTRARGRAMGSGSPRRRRAAL